MCAFWCDGPRRAWHCLLEFLPRANCLSLIMRRHQMFHVGGCYHLNVFVPPKFTYWNPKANMMSEGGAFGRWLKSWEWNLHGWGQYLIKEALERFPRSFPPYEDITRRCLLWTRKRTSPKYGHAGTLILDFQRTVKNKHLFVVFKLLCLWSNWTLPERTKAEVILQSV